MYMLVHVGLTHETVIQDNVSIIYTNIYLSTALFFCIGHKFHLTKQSKNVIRYVQRSVSRSWQSNKGKLSFIINIDIDCS